MRYFSKFAFAENKFSDEYAEELYGKAGKTGKGKLTYPSIGDITKGQQNHILNNYSSRLGRSATVAGLTALLGGVSIGAPASFAYTLFKKKPKTGFKIGLGITAGLASLGGLLEYKNFPKNKEIELNRLKFVSDPVNYSAALSKAKEMAKNTPIELYGN